jgi:hypothetical protein
MRVENGYTEAQEEQPYDEEKKATEQFSAEDIC